MLDTGAHDAGRGDTGCYKREQDRFYYGERESGIEFSRSRENRRDREMIRPGELYI